jgi:magnesium chelatase family protein
MTILGGGVLTPPSILVLTLRMRLIQAIITFSYRHFAMPIVDYRFAATVPIEPLKSRFSSLLSMYNISDCVHPCSCGNYLESQKPCTCAPAVVTKYQKRISGPILDRIDIHIEVPGVDYEKLSSDRLGETSASIRARVQAARDIQTKRFHDHSTDIICNAHMCVGEIRKFCRLPDEGQSLMRAAMTQLNLSARAYHRILKLACTFADLAGCEEIQSTHLAEALQYRPKLMLI